MEDAFKGKAANSIRAFYQESHMPFLVFMEGFITDFQDTLAKIKDSLASLEPDEQGYIRESFLREDVKQGLKNAENVTMTLTDEANSIISSVGDIVPLPSVDDSDFLDRSQQARKKTDHTLEKLYTFDSESTRALDKPQNDLDLMQTYINKLGGMVSSGDISIGNYSVQQLSQHDFHQDLISGVRGKAVQNMLSLDVLIGKGAANLLSRYVPYSGAWVNMLAEKFEMKTAEYSFRALSVVSASVGSDISEQEFATVKGQVVNTEKVSDYKNEWYGNYHTLMDGRIIREYMDNEGNVNYKFVSEIPESRLKPAEEEEKNAFQKSVGAFKEIGLDIWSGFEERGQKATDSWYDFGNYLTLGAFDLAKNTHSGLQYNAENMLNSPSDFANWLTMGGVDMVNGAVNPDEAFSKEHWKSSFGLFLTGVGARGVSAPKSSGMPKTNSKVTSNDQESTVSAAKATSATRKLPTLTNIREWYRANVPEMGLVQDSMGGYYFAVKKGDGENSGNSSVNGGKVEYGGHYTRVNRKKALKPNIEYTTKEGYKYKTDDKGRISVAEAKLELGQADRNQYAQRKVGGDDRLENDDGGHLIASIFKGSGDIDNLVPMDATLNRSEYKTIENEWKKALEEGKEVTVKLKPIYQGQSVRPTEFKLNYTIDGKKYSDRLTNYTGGH